MAGVLRRVAEAHPLALLALLLLALRGAALLTGIERVVFEEELYRGTLAKELIDGLKLPLLSYRPDPYSLGFLGVGFLAVPGFAIFGPTLLALKLVPIAFSLGILVLLFAFLDRCFGRRAALAGGVLLVLSPPGPTQLSLLAMGFHTESVLLSLAILLAWSRFLAEPSRPAGLGLVGLATGAGISFTYIAAITGAACLASAAFVPPRPSRRGVGWFVLGVVVGLLPWTAANVAGGFEGISWVTGLLAPRVMEAGHSPLSLLLRLARKAGGVLLIGLPQFNAFPSLAGIPGLVLSYVYWAIGTVLVAALVLRHRDGLAKVLPLLLWIVLFVVAYVLTGYDVPRHEAVLGTINFRFFAPPHLAMLLLVAVAIVRIRAGPAALLVLASLGLAGQATLLSLHVPAHLAAYRGYSYAQLGGVWAVRLYLRSQTFAEAEGVLARFPEPARTFVYRGLFDNTQERWPDPLAILARLGEVPAPYRGLAVEAVAGTVARHRAADPGGIEAIARSWPPAERDHLYRGYAAGLARTWRGLLGSRRDFEGQPPAFRRWFDLSFGALAAEACYGHPGAGDCADAMLEVRALDGKRRAWAYRGIGQVAAYNFLGLLVLEEERAAGGPLPPSHRADFFWGAGWAMRDAFSEDPLRALDWIDRLPADGHAAALEGLRACEAWHRLPAARPRRPPV